MNKKYNFSVIFGKDNESEVRRLIDELLRDSPGVEVKGNRVTITDLDEAFRFRMRADEALNLEG